MMLGNSFYGECRLCYMLQQYGVRCVDECIANNVLDAIGLSACKAHQNQIEHKNKMEEEKERHAEIIKTAWMNSINPLSQFSGATGFLAVDSGSGSQNTVFYVADGYGQIKLNKKLLLTRKKRK